MSKTIYGEKVVADLRVEVARLQARVEEAESELKAVWERVAQGEHTLEIRTNEIAGYKALAERCGEALKPFLDTYESMREQEKERSGKDIERDFAALLAISLKDIRQARAALALTPEQAREKKGKR